MSNQPNNLNNVTLTYRPLPVVRRWWIFAFIVSLIVFSSTLLLLGGEAYAKSGGGGGDGLRGLPSGGSGGGDSNKGGSDAAKGGGANLDGKAGGVLMAGGDAPANNISSGDSKPSRDVLGDATGSLRDSAKNDGSESSEGTPSPTAENSEPVIGSAERVADTAEPMMKPVGPKLGEEVARIGQAIDPVAEEAAKTVEPVEEVTDPVVTPIKETVAPVVEPLSETVGPMLAPLTEETSPLLESLESPLEHVFAPVTGAVEQPVLELVPAEEVVPLLRDQPSWSQTGESLAYWTAPPALATAAAASSSVNSGAAPVDQVNLEGSASSATTAEQQVTMRTSALSDSYLGRVGLSLFGEGLAHLNLAGIEGAQNQMPQPFPASGMPMAAGGFSGGSSSSSNGGLDTGILGLLAVLLLGGKFLWSARDFLKPNAALLLAIERPG